MRNCKKIHPLLSLYRENQLSPRDQSRVEGHLKECADARVELEKLDQLRQALRGMPEPKIPSDLHDKIMSGLRGKAKPFPAHRQFWVMPSWGLAVAAMLTFLVIAQYPNWKEQLVAPPTKGNDQAKSANAPMEKEVPFAPQQPSVGIVSGKKEPSTSFGILGKANSEKGLANDNFAEVRKDENKNFDQRVSQDFPARAKAKKAQRSAPASRVSPEPLAVVAASKPSSQNNLTEAEPKTKQMEGAEVPTAAQSGGSAPAPSAEAPPAALPSVSLDQSYKNVPYSQEQSVLTWTSNNAPSTVEGQELVTEGETFNQYWRALQTDQAMPVLDFTKQAVVVLIAGIKPTPGYSIHIARLEEKTDQLVVHYRVEIPSADAVLPQMITRPWSMQVIPKPSKPVVFLKDL